MEGGVSVEKSASSVLAGDAALRDHFDGEVRLAARNQGVDVTPPSHDYLVGLLIDFSKVSALPPVDPEVRFFHPPLLELWAAAQEARGGERLARLRTLGDLSLFVSGYFPDALGRRLVDIDYYIQMGCHAYHRIAADLRAAGFQEMYLELAGKFPRLVDLLAEVSSREAGRPSQSLLRLYERWLKTRSAWAARRLGERGVVPVDPGEGGELQ